MTDCDTAAIRAGYSYPGAALNPDVANVIALLDECDRLRARLAAVEAERDHGRLVAIEYAKVYARADAAEARLAAVEALCDEQDEKGFGGVGIPEVRAAAAGDDR